ncbi:Hypothetical protein A7982_02279 [Minicystis rosea]|nr:Hypothetical protein A7982_02279 [Minicystis rosea]
MWITGAISTGIALVSFASCGGSSSGGTGGGGATGGSGGCGDDEGIDCECNGELYGPSCVDGVWDCGTCEADVSCSLAEHCEEYQYCAFDDGECGKSALGVCRAVDELVECDPEPNGFVCGCDGQQYATACDAFAAGIDTSPEPFCPASP